jgi:hypothetical protein
MKLIHVKFSIVLVSAVVYGVDPFETANDLYSKSEWDQAYNEYRIVHKQLKKEPEAYQKYDKLDIIRGHVNYADVLYAKGVGELGKGNKDTAKKLMLKACKNWRHRLEGRQFGRAPLPNEWDGSDLTGKKILVYSERDGGAFGDSFYMTALLRYLKEDKGAHVIFVPQRPLANFYRVAGTEQSQYVDEVAVRGTDLPEHHAATYLWSILEYYLHDKDMSQAFPLKSSMSGTSSTEFIGLLDTKVTEYRQKHGTAPLIVGGWWRSSGNASLAADWRTLDRDPGAHRILSVVEGLPAIFVNLEGLGRRPLSQKELDSLVEKREQGNSDPIDVTTYDTSHVINMPAHFDKDVAFGNTAAVMQWIKKSNGVLVGCDTGLANLAAGIVKSAEQTDPSVYVVLNKKADMRWGDDLTSPRPWHHSADVRVFQAPEQGKWEVPLDQIRKEIMQRILKLKK